MITYRILNPVQVNKLAEIDRSEYIDLTYQMEEGKLVEFGNNHECPTWTDDMMKEIQERYLYELNNGGLVIGAFDGETLVAFGVLAHEYRGLKKDQLQIDLMYVDRKFRRQGIGTRIFNLLGDEARRRGAAFLYISSTETRSAVSFYRSNGSQLTQDIDQELFIKEPKDIHMTVKL